MGVAENGLSEQERKRGERVFLLEAAAVSATTAFSGEVIIAALLKAIGAKPWATTLLMSGMFLGGLCQLLAPGIIEHFRSRKRVCVVSFGVARGARFLLPLLPLVLFTSLAPWYIPLHFGVTVLMGAFGSVGMIGRMSWVSDLVPEGELGDFWSSRMLTSRALDLVLPLLAGVSVTWWHAGHQGLAAELPVFQVLFLVGAVFGVGSWLCFVAAPEPRFLPDPEHKSFFGSVGKAFRDRAYRPLILFRALFAFSGGLGMGMGSAHMIQVLKVSTATVCAFMAVGSLAGMYTMRFWGKMIDKFGCRPVLFLATVAMGLWYAGWALVQPGTWWLAGGLYLLFVFQSALDAGLITMATKMAPVEGRAAYLTAQSTVAHLGWAVAPLLGSGLAWLLEGHSLPVGFGELNNLQMVLVAGGALRFLCLPLLMEIREPRVRTVGRMVQVLRGHSGFRPGRDFYDFMFFWFAPVVMATREVARGAGRLTRNLRERIESLRSSDPGSEDPD